MDDRIDDNTSGAQAAVWLIGLFLFALTAITLIAGLLLH